MAVIAIIGTIDAFGTTNRPVVTPEMEAACKDLDLVEYSKPLQRNIEAIHIQSMPRDSNELLNLNGLERLKSPGGTKWLVIRSADFSRPGPWNTTVYVFGNRAQPVRFKVTFTDHANGGVHATWLNEKLLFLDMWWGRIVSTDMILDVETSSFLYINDASYARSIIPCNELLEMYK